MKGLMTAHLKVRPFKIHPRCRRLRNCAGRAFFGFFNAIHRPSISCEGAKAISITKPPIITRSSDELTTLALAGLWRFVTSACALSQPKNNMPAPVRKMVMRNQSFMGNPADGIVRSEDVDGTRRQQRDHRQRDQRLNHHQALGPA